MAGHKEDSAKDLSSLGNPANQTPGMMEGQLPASSSIYGGAMGGVGLGQSPFAIAFDPSNIPSTAGVGKADFLFEDADKKSRATHERLFYTAGLAYLVGQGVGTTWGAIEGLRHPGGNTFRLRVNTVLNAVNKRGPFLGNSLGMLALIYQGTTSGINAVVGTHGDEPITQVAAATATGLLYKSTAGPRSMVVAGGLGGALMVGGILATRWYRGDLKSLSATQFA